MSKKRRVKKIIMHKTPRAVGSLNEHIDSLYKKLGEVEERNKKLVMALAQQMAQMWKNIRAVAESIDHLDTSSLAAAEVLKELYVELAFHDAALKELATGKNLEIDEETATALGVKQYQEVVRQSFEVVQTKKAEDEKKKQEEEAQRTAAMQAAEKAASELSIAEDALQNAEKPPAPGEPLAPPSSEPEFPEGAQIFGG